MARSQTFQISVTGVLNLTTLTVTIYNQAVATWASVGIVDPIGVTVVAVSPDCARLNVTLELKSAETTTGSFTVQGELEGFGGTSCAVSRRFDFSITDGTVAISALYDSRKRRVRIVSDKSEGPTAGAHDFDALEFLARLLTYVPDHHEICVRYYGAYSVRRRARWRKFGILDDTRMRTDDASQDDTPSWPEIQARRRRWAELLRRIFEVDPLRCPRCGGNMSILAFVLEQHAIDAILKHLRRTRHDPARLTEHDDLLARPPP